MAVGSRVPTESAGHRVARRLRRHGSPDASAPRVAGPLMAESSLFPVEMRPSDGAAPPSSSSSGAAATSAPADDPAAAAARPASSYGPLDFIASSHAVKNLFSLGLVDQSISVAIHNVDGTLLLDYAEPFEERASGDAAKEAPALTDQEGGGDETLKASQEIIAFPSELGTLKDNETLATILAKPPPSTATSGSHGDGNDRLGLPVPDDYVQRFLPNQKEPSPREYLPWRFNDLQLLIGSNATIYRSPATPGGSESADHGPTAVPRSSPAPASTSVTVRVEHAGNLRALLERHEQDRRLSLQNRPSYADVTKSVASPPRATKPVGTPGVDPLSDDERCLQTCIVSAPSLPVGGLLSSRRGAFQQQTPQGTTAHPGLPTQASPVSTVLDIYLDNIMANVPQLALCLQDKGLIQSVKLLSTDDIPSLLMHRSTLETSTPFSVMKGDGSENVFSPEVMETNASMLLRFLRANCTSNNTTYLLRREQGDTNIQLYDISTLSTRGQKRWVFWLAMMSYRFANRLRHVAMAGAAQNPALRRTWRARQRSLLRNTLDLLEKLADMDGNQRESLAAAVNEHLADSMLGLEDGEGVETRAMEEGRSGHGSDHDFRPPTMPTTTACISTIQQPYANVSLDALGKAQDHLERGIKALMPVLEREVRQYKERRVDMSAKERGDSHTIFHAAFRRRIEPVATQLLALHYKFVNVSLRLAEIHLSNYFSSSAMQALRSSSRCLADSLYLIQLLDRDTDTRVSAWLLRLQLQYTWLWEHCGHFARSFAADQLWRERGHASGDDVISVLQEVEAAFRDHSSLRNDERIRTRFVEPENPLTKLSQGAINFHYLSGIVDFTAPIGKKKVKIRLSSVDKETAETLLSEQRMILREKRRVLVAASLAYSQAIKTFRDLLQEEVLDDNLQSETDTALLGLLEQRLGDSCNETGKILLNELRKLLAAAPQPSDSKEKEAKSYLGYFLSSAQFWFFQALEVFEACQDSRNLALLRCNLCQAYKLQANSLFISTTKPMEGQSHAEICLQEAVHHLEAAHESLGERDSDPLTWNFVSEELAATFLVLGVRRRQSLIGSGSLPVIMQALRLSPGKEQSIVDPIERALHIYEQLGNRHQAAAAHYQLALYYTKIWTVQVNETKTRDKLSLAFQHFNAAYAYFSEAVQGNEITFCLLCIDSSGLYATVTGMESICKALLRCVDTVDALSRTVVDAKLKDLQSRADWFNQMDVVATAINERVFKALKNLVKIESETDSGEGIGRYKELYRVALQTKMTPMPSDVYCGDESIDKVANRLHALHSILTAIRKQYNETCV